jgi:SAM-dependent methyltransferase
MSESLPALAYDAFDRPPLHAVRFLAQAAPRPAPRTLDVGCGTGRMLLALVERGWPAVGIEPDPVLRERAYARLGGRAAVVEGSVETLDVGEGWELVAVVNGPLSQVVRREDRREALARLRAALAPGGVVVLDLPNLPWIFEHYREPKPVQRALGGWSFTRDRRREIDRAQGVLIQRDHYYAERGAERVEWDAEGRHAVVPWSELAEDLDHVGLGDHRTHASLADLAPGPTDGPRIVMVARR